MKEVVSKVWLIYLFCALAALLEGFDNLTGAVIAPGFSSDFGMTPDRIGLVFFATSIGMLIGALIGGWANDRYGLRIGLCGGVAMFGLASLLGIVAPDGTTFTMTRALVGVGMGATMPSILILLGSAGPPESAARRAAMASTMISVGSLVFSIFTKVAPERMPWRAFLHIGGWFPIALAVLVLLFLPDSGEHRRDRPLRPLSDKGGWRALFAGDRKVVTLLFWGVFFISSATLLLVLNWMPSFLARIGVARRDIGSVMIFYSLGSIAGPTVLAPFLRPRFVRYAVAVAYAGLASSLFGLMNAGGSVAMVSTVIFVTALFAVGIQGALMGMVGSFYPPEARGAGVGATIAIGRIGCGAGPMAAGLALAAGASPSQVLAAFIPIQLLGVGGMMLILARAPAELAPTRRSPLVALAD